MKKLLTRLSNNKGMTLVELIVVLFVSSVILMIATGLVYPAKELMKSLKSNAHMDTVCATANEYIRGSVQAATALQLFRLDSTAADYTANDFSADEAAINSFISGASGKVRAIAILDVGTSADPVYRIFDFGEISGNYGELKNRIDAKAEDDYAFLEPFYEGENNSYAVEIDNNSGGWLQLSSRVYRDGEPVNQEHRLSFKLLNSFAAASGAGTDEAIDGGSCYLILYTIRSWD